MIAADRTCVGTHGNSAQAETFERAQVSHEHLVIGMDRVFLGQVKGIGVLHQEFARAHRAEAWTHLVAELQLNMIEVQRQVLVGLHIGTEDVGDHLLIGGAVEHLTILAVLDAQHLLTVVVVTAAFLPEFRGLQGRHQKLDGAGAVLLLADNLVDLVQHTLAQRQPGINASRLLPDHAGAQHETVRNDFRFLGVFLQDGHEITAETHDGFH